MKHRKEEGIYYTPKYIVDYIVNNTLGKALAEMPRERAGKIKILDPACGSGSFLIKALEIMDNYYAADEEYKNYPFNRRIKSLQNNIFGVDLDDKAVEIAQLNLLLRTLVERQKLPDISSNIKSGNSLIDDAKIAKDKAFIWEEEFQIHSNNDKFDVIIGNPPYDVVYSNARPKD